MILAVKPGTVASGRTLQFERLLWFQAGLQTSNSCETSKAAVIRETLRRAPLATKLRQLKLFSTRNIPGLMKTTYVFSVIKTDCRPFPVPRIVSQFTGIRTISWVIQVRNLTQVLSDSEQVIAATNYHFAVDITLLTSWEIIKYNILINGENHSDILHQLPIQAHPKGC